MMSRKIALLSTCSVQCDESNDYMTQAMIANTMSQNGKGGGGGGGLQTYLSRRRTKNRLGTRLYRRGVSPDTM